MQWDSVRPLIRERMHQRVIVC